MTIINIIYIIGIIIIVIIIIGINIIIGIIGIHIYDLCDGLRGESEIFGASDPFRAWFDCRRELEMKEEENMEEKEEEENMEEKEKEENMEEENEREERTENRGRKGINPIEGGPFGRF